MYELCVGTAPIDMQNNNGDVLFFKFDDLFDLIEMMRLLEEHKIKELEYLVRIND